MLDNIPRFDMKKPPMRQKLRWLMKIIAPLTTSKQGQIIHKENMDGIKPPYILMGNHNSYYDLMVLEQAILPNRCNYVVAIDGFIGREWLLRLKPSLKMAILWLSIQRLDIPYAALNQLFLRAMLL